MNVVIYQSLIIYVFVLIYGVHTNNVVIGGNISGLLGENGTQIECSYTIVDIVSVSFLAFNKSNTTLKTIATYRPDRTPVLTSQGQYLEGRVTLTPITRSSTKAVMTFNQLMCIDDISYQCQVFYFETGDLTDLISNNILSISVQVPPLKPDRLSLVYPPANSPVTTTNDMEYSTSLPSTRVTSIENNSISVSKMESQNTTTAFNYSTIQTTGHTTTPTPYHEDDVSSNVSYKTTTNSIQQTTSAIGIAEGDNITVVCSGEVGKPPAKHVFKKYSSDQILYMTYTATETSISEMSVNCSYYRTSYLTFKVTAADNNAVIRCVVNSSMAEPDMFVETKPIEVYYKVSMPTITRYPNNSYYIVDEATSINLTCKGNGNPKPNYQWYKENINEPVSTSANWTITDINVTNSGVYTCNVSNTFNGDTYRNAKQVQINIMNKDDVPTTQSSSTCSTSCVGKKEVESKGNFGLVVGIVVAVVTVFVVIIVVIAYRRRKSKSPTFKNVSKSSDDSKQKPGTEPRTGDYETIPLGDDAPKTKSSNYGFEAEDINMHNAEYLKKDEEEKRKNESNTPPQPAVYAQVNEASKLKNKQKTEAIDSIGNQEEDTYAETQEGIYDKAGNRRHKEKKKDEHYDSSNNLSKQNSNGDSKLAIQTSQVGSYANQGFEKDDNRKVATVSPTVRSSGGSQNDEQTNSNRNSQSKKGYENIIGTEQTGNSEDDSSHRTAL